MCYFEASCESVNDMQSFAEIFNKEIWVPQDEKLVA